MSKFENLKPSNFPQTHPQQREGGAKRRGCVMAKFGVSLKAIGRDLGLDVSVRAGALLMRPQLTAHSYQQMMWRKSLSINSSFCKAVVAAGYLTWPQMLDAVCRYRLGATLNGGVIFWQINHEERICDGKVMYYAPDCHRRKEKEYDPTWVSALLLKRQGGKCVTDFTRHCLFGLHLLHPKSTDLLMRSIPAANFGLGSEAHANANETGATSPPVAVVEAEKTAVILSAHYPQYLWLATGGMWEVQAEKFRPLKGCKVILFPDTDTDGKTFAHWYQAAEAIMAQPFWENSPPIRVSALLEQHATPDQKRRKIDLVDWIAETELSSSLALT